MSETLDKIEYRLSPEYMKREAKDFLYETVDDVRDRFHPRHIASRASENMKNTVQDHPIPSLIAGLSIGYLLMKSGEKRRRSSYPEHEQYSFRSSARRARAYGDHTGRARDHRGRYRKDERSSRGEYSQESHREDHDSGVAEQMRSASERATETGKEVREQATQQAREMTERAGEWAEEASQQARSAGRRMERGARQAQGQVRTFVDRNPLMAGAVALGVGALFGGMFPSTRAEDEWMGPARDEVMHRAEEATEETMHRAQEAAENVAEEAERAAEDVAETTQEEAERVTDTAKEEGENVKDEAKRQANDKSQRPGS